MPRLLLALLIFPFVTLPAHAQDLLPVVGEVDLAGLRQHGQQLRAALAQRQAPLPPAIDRQLAALLHDGADPQTVTKVQQVLDPFCLAEVSINPESRVKAARGPAKAELRLGEEKVFLLKIRNDAGVTHALTVSGTQLIAARHATEGQWLKAQVQAIPAARQALSGQKVEYLLLFLLSRAGGKREVTLKFDVGQGSQDLGFRAEVPILFTVRGMSDKN